MPYKEHLHIISFNVPYPPNYGGVIDVYYKIKALIKKGIKVHLHTFQYGREKSPELEELCYKVLYYPRLILSNPLNINNKLPYIVKTRKSKELLDNLLKDNYPIFFEGIHCSFYIDIPELFNRTCIIRMHNIEHIYYKNLARIEKNPIKKNYYNLESKKLRDFEKRLISADYIASISPSDHKILNIKYKNSFYLPAFHPNTRTVNLGNKGDYILYHGNLGVGENNEAALYLVNEIFNNLKVPFKIAGMNPSKELRRSINGQNHIELISEVSHKGINDLIKNAQINIMPTFQETGIKLKLINALFLGRYCLVNTKMIRNTNLEDLCLVTDKSDTMKGLIKEYFNKEFTKEEQANRKKVLEDLFDNNRNVEILLEKLYS